MEVFGTIVLFLLSVASMFYGVVLTYLMVSFYSSWDRFETMIGLFLIAFGIVGLYYIFLVKLTITMNP